MPPALPAVVSRNEKGEQRELSWPELRRQVASLALHLQATGRAARRPRRGVPAQHSGGDGRLPRGGEHRRRLEHLRAGHGHQRRAGPLQADRAQGADRLRRRALRRPRLRPHRRGGRAARRAAERQHLVVHRNLGAGDAALQALAPWTDMADARPATTPTLQAFEPLWLPFDHPLWIVYSSGTTGLPKPIVHGHGGTVLVVLALKVLHNDIGCSYEPNSWGERYHWYSSTGWVMWNAQVGGLLDGTTCCIYDGNPGGSQGQARLDRAVALRRRPAA